MLGGRGVSAGHPCSAHALPRLLRYAAKRTVRIMPWGGSMLDETGFYAPSVAHNALPGRPWPGISVFLGHNSTVSKQLRYSLMRESVPQLVSGDKAPYAVAECRLIGVQCRNSMKKYKYGKRKIMMTKNCRYATINSKHYISVSGTT